VPYERVFAAGFEDTRRRVPDTSRIRSLLGWQPRYRLDETLRSVIAHLSEQLRHRAADAEHRKATVIDWPGPARASVAQ
jgi:UDP-glucose 4-epimerase